MEIPFSKPAFAFILFVFLIYSGCNRTEYSTDSLVIDPLGLDFGKKRPSDSPLSLELNLINETQEPVEILSMIAGCSCIILEQPKRILPATRTRVAIKIDISGRSGKFQDYIRIKAFGESRTGVKLSRESLTVPEPGRELRPV